MRANKHAARSVNVVLRRTLEDQRSLGPAACPRQQLSGRRQAASHCLASMRCLCSQPRNPCHNARRRARQRTHLWGTVRKPADCPARKSARWRSCPQGTACKLKRWRRSPPRKDLAKAALRPVTLCRSGPAQPRSSAAPGCKGQQHNRDKHGAARLRAQRRRPQNMRVASESARHLDAPRRGHTKACERRCVLTAALDHNPSPGATGRVAERAGRAWRGGVVDQEASASAIFALGA